MAKDYIEREAAKEELVSWARCINDPKYLLTEDAMCVLDGMKAADVVEVVHGRWHDVYMSSPSSFVGTCSVCGMSNDIPPPAMAHYCPNCGARMDGE